jgi:dTDP-glucose 4,6-dehydratase
MPLFIHGDGSHTRRYLFAGDAASAFDTILHRGEFGQIYNVDSRDEISNLDLAKRLLGMFGISDIQGWIQYTRDRPFNDCRYAVDGTKLRQLGWKQNVSFAEGLGATMDWYCKFSNWWGPIDNTLLSPFPVVQSGHVIDPVESEKGEQEVDVGARDDRIAKAAPVAASNGISGVGKKRKADMMTRD